MEANPEYRRAFEMAQEDASDSLEAEVYRRAVKGVRKLRGLLDAHLTRLPLLCWDVHRRSVVRPTTFQVAVLAGTPIATAVAQDPLPVGPIVSSDERTREGALP